MILWSSRELEKALAAGQLEPWTKVKYLLIPLILGALLSTPFYIFRPVFGQETSPLSNFIFLGSGVISAFILYWGVKECFRANNRIDGKVFFERFAVLFVPVFIKIAVFFFLISFIFVMTMIFLLDTRIMYLGTIIMVSVFRPVVTFIMYTMLKNSFERLGLLMRKNV